MIQLLGTLSLLFFSCLALAQDQLEGNWFSDSGNAKINIYKGKDSRFYGKIVWLKEPLRNGKPKVDEKNPESSRRNQPILGLEILRGFEKDGNEYEDGTVYDPKSGKTYSGKIKLKGNKLDMRGYIGISLIGRTTTWTRAEK
jgi:uncharacterized protein (DUF2147 family)